MQTTVALERLLRARERLPPEQQAPELMWLIENFEGLEAVLPQLREAQEVPGPPPPTPQLGWRHCPQLFKGLVGLVLALARGVDASGHVGLSPGLMDVLLASSLFPLLCYNGGDRSSMAVFLPTEGQAASANPTAVLQMLVAGAVLKLQQDHEQTAQQQQQQQQAVTPLAQALAAQLSQHCPHVALQQLQRAVLTLRLFFACGVPNLPPAQQQALLADCQQLLAWGPPGSAVPAAMWGSQIVLCSLEWCGMSAQRAAAVDALLEAAIAEGERTQCWISAAQIACQFASWSIDWQAARRPASRSAQSGRPQIRGAPDWLLARLKRLSQAAHAALAASKPWALQSHRSGLKSSLKQLDHDIGVLARGGVLTAGASLGTYHKAELAECAHCKSQVMHVQKCSACRSVQYCSKECQRAHWRAGHKRECAQLAAARAGGAGAASGGAAAGAGGAGMPGCA